MIKHAAFALAALLTLCASMPALAGPASAFPDGLGVASPAVPVWPPEQFRRNSAAIVVFLDPQGLAKFCGLPDDPTKVAIGCAGQNDKGAPVMALPNPCLIEPDDPYAAVVCHELAHANGWKHEAAAPPAAPDDQADPAIVAAAKCGPEGTVDWDDNPDDPPPHCNRDGWNGRRYTKGN